MRDHDRRGRFAFDVTTTGTMSIDGEDARQARDAPLRMLDGATATIVTRSDGDLAMTDLRPSDDVVLVLVDGIDTVAGLAEAIRAFRRGGDAP